LPIYKEWVLTLKLKINMFKHYFEGISGIANYPIFSLLVFVVFFIWLGYWVYNTSKEYTDYMGNIPLNDKEKNQ
jgi:cytochrome c oxidase cbb3-type subunit IV